MLNQVRTSFLIAVLVACAAWGKEEGKAPPRRIKVACVGDSITQGHGIPDQDNNGYPAQLGKMLGQGWGVSNFGVTGHTLLKNGNAPYVGSRKYEEALASKPDVVIIMLGTNDTKPENWNKKDEYIGDYLALIESFRKIDSKPVVWICKPVPVFPERWGITDRVMREEVIPRIQSIAQKAGVPVIDLHTPFQKRPELFPDKVHPNVAGATEIAKIIAGLLSTYGEDAPPPDWVHSHGRATAKLHAAEENGGRTKMTATLKNYVEQFNAVDKEEGVNTIHNKDVFEFLADNIPLFECPDEDFQRTYYYRWWTFRKHLRKTEDGWVVTEFYPDVSWAKKHNTINCPLGHQIYEGRWLRDRKYINEYIKFHFTEDGNPGGESKHYSNWLTDAVYAHYMVTGDKSFATGLLDDLIVNHRNYSKDGKGGWARSRFFEDIGLYWQIDSWDGSEVSISGTGVRPSINSYLYGSAVAIAKIAELAGKADVAKAYQQEAKVLKQTMLEKLWDADAKFFKTMRDDRAKGNYNNTRIEDCESGKLVKVRELYGYAPWYFNMPDQGKGYEAAWAQLTDPQGFKGKFGPGFAERRHPNFSLRGGWGGCSWPLATSQTLTALANVLNNYAQDVIGKQEYFDTLQSYTRSHVVKKANGVVVPWIDEAVNQDTGRWIFHWLDGKISGRYYNHSSYCDLIITGLVGLRPRADDVVEVNPLLPKNTWRYFCLDNVLYRGRILTIIWDKTGEKYGKGKGLTVFADKKKIAQAMTLSRTTGKLK